MSRLFPSKTPVKRERETGCVGNLPDAGNKTAAPGFLHTRPPTPAPYPPPLPYNRKDNPPCPTRFFTIQPIEMQCNTAELTPRSPAFGSVFLCSVPLSRAFQQCTRSPTFESALLCYSKETLASHPSVTCGFRRVCRGARPLTRALPLYSSLIPVAIIPFSGEALT